MPFEAVAGKYLLESEHPMPNTPSEAIDLDAKIAKNYVSYILKRLTNTLKDDDILRKSDMDYVNSVVENIKDQIE